MVVSDGMREAPKYRGLISDDHVYSIPLDQPMEYVKAAQYLQPGYAMA